MRAPLDKIVIGAKLRSNDKRTLGKEVEIVDVIRGLEVFAVYKTNTRVAKINANDIFVEAHKSARGWGLVGA